MKRVFLTRRWPINIDQSLAGGGSIGHILRRNCASQSDRIHSTDIAFKPNESGWGYNKKYVNNFDTIFKKSKASTATDDDKTSSVAEQQSVSKSVQHAAILNSFAELTVADKKLVAADLQNAYPDCF